MVNYMYVIVLPWVSSVYGICISPHMYITKLGVARLIVFEGRWGMHD